jgi:tetratricopeptide (TPR) repeat protein
MKRNLFSVSLLTAIFALGGSYALAQQNQQPAAADPNNPCNEYKPEQLKQLNEEQRKKYDEEVKACKETLAKINKVKNVNEVVSRVAREGKEAFDSKKYDVAIAKYEEGYQADTDFMGTAPQFLSYKAIALRMRGIDKLNAAIQSKDKQARDAGKADAAKDFQEAANSVQKAVELYAKNPTPPKEVNPQEYETRKFDALRDRAESFRLLIIADATKIPDSLTAFEEYINAEKDATKKVKYQYGLAQALFQNNKLDESIAQYKQIIAAQPNNYDAIYELGSALVVAANIDPDKPDKAKLQEAATYFEKVVKSPPSGFAQEKIDDAKGQLDIINAKPAATTGGRRKN